MSQSSQPFSQYDDDPNPRNGLTGKAVQWAVLVLFGALVMVPMLTYGCRGERVKWQTASAMALYNKGEKEQAIEKMSAMAEDFRTDTRISSLYANVLAENGRAQEGLEWCEAVLEQNENAIELLQSKANCEQFLNRPLDALETSKSISPLLKETARRSSGYLNNLAYYRALAGTELHRAEQEMSRVIRDQALVSDWGSGYRLNLVTRSLISAGMLARKLDCHNDALEWLDTHIEKLKSAEDEHDTEMTSNIYAMIQDRFPLGAGDEIKLTENERRQLDESRDNLAFLLLTRALVHQDLGQKKKSEVDRLDLQALGYDSEKMLNALPSNRSCFDTLDQAATYLDTYGFVLFKLGKFSKALTNMDIAILASEYNLKGLDSPLHNSSEELMFDASESRPLYERTTAVLYYHRYLLNLRRQELVGDEKGLEEADARRIRELGFDPNSRLF